MEWHGLQVNTSWGFAGEYPISRKLSGVYKPRPDSNREISGEAGDNAFNTPELKISEAKPSVGGRLYFELKTIGITKFCFTYFPSCFAGIHGGEILNTLIASISKHGFALRNILMSQTLPFVSIENCIITLPEILALTASVG
jgi:hypothetical protein